MKPNMYDMIQTNLKDIRGKVREELKQRFAHVKPYGKEAISEAEQLYEYNTMTPDKLMQKINTEGRDSVNNWIFNMEQIKNKFAQKRGQNG